MALVRSPLAVSIGLFAGAVAARLLTHTSQATGILLLLIAPILLMSLAYRPRVGSAVAAASLAAFLICEAIDGALEPVSIGTRAFTYFAIPLTIWLARIDAERRDAFAPSEPADQPAKRRGAETGAQALTHREREVLALVAAGHTSVQIAATLVLSVRTIESHRASIRRKLDRPSPPELARHAQVWGILPSQYTPPPSRAVAPI